MTEKKAPWTPDEVVSDEAREAADEDEPTIPPPDAGADCDHGITFDQEEADKILSQPFNGTGDVGVDFVMGHPGSAEVRRRWPRGHFTAEHPCPKGCGYIGLYYASAEHYMAGDW